MERKYSAAYIEVDLVDKIKSVCRKLGRGGPAVSVSSFVRYCIREELKRRGVK